MESNFCQHSRNFRSKEAQNIMQEWLVNLDHKDYPYILDWYYTSHHHQHGPQDIETGLIDVEDEALTNTWAPPDVSNRHHFDDNRHPCFEDRISSNLEASASRTTVIQHHEFKNPSQAAQSHWWARKGDLSVARTGVGPEASFLEPPNFHQNGCYGHRDNLSEGSSQEQDQRFGWDVKEQDFNLLFDDIYDAHSQSPPRTSF
ncbi:hypothetical protein SSX86_026812 [Deinandra increscens subsp. villosa]|uniref:Autophagy-related protein 9 n=1 Tax=Deinandra increscens subsp. villosa TaxID=3103831 RepID=A0AAP0CKB3_9ASTR